MMASTRTLYLVRHAVAAERGDEWPDDTKRPLTSDGAAKFRRAVRGLAVLGVEIDLVLSSPLTRTMETAEILARSVEPRADIVECPALAPGHAAARVAEALAAHVKPRAIALVGHEPGLGELAAWLIGARAPIPLKKGGACRIDTAEWPPARQGTLRWLATAGMLRKIRAT